VAPEPNHLKGAIDAFNDNRLPGAGAARYTPRGITLSYYKEEVTVLTINQLFYGEGTKQDVATHRPAYPYECIRFTLPRPVRSPMTWETHGPIPRAPTPTTYVPANVDPDDAAAVEYAEAARRYEAAHGPPTAIAQKPKVGAPFGVVNIREEDVPTAESDFVLVSCLDFRSAVNVPREGASDADRIDADEF
jgi:hypothetical protein